MAHNYDTLATSASYWSNLYRYFILLTLQYQTEQKEKKFLTIQKDSRCAGGGGGESLGGAEVFWMNYKI